VNDIRLRICGGRGLARWPLIIWEATTSRTMCPIVRY